MLENVEEGRIFDAYQNSYCTRLSDYALIKMAIDIVKIPKAQFSSFTMHAPLEVMARAELLPFVHPDARYLARAGIFAAAQVYDGYLEYAPAVAAAPFDQSCPQRLMASIEAGDEAGAAAYAKALGEHFHAADLTRSLCDHFVDQISAGAHAHIFLFFLDRMGSRAPRVATQMLEGFARELARSKGPRFRSQPFAPLRRSQPQGFLETFSEVPLIGKPKQSGIRHILAQAEQLEAFSLAHGQLVAPEGNWATRQNAFQTYLRLAAHSMIVEPDRHAKYGWTHCLTLTQAASRLVTLSANPALYLEAATLYLIAYRAAIATEKYTELWRPEPMKPDISLEVALRTDPEMACQVAANMVPDQVWLCLASAASVRPDCHLVKYVLACHDCAKVDPEYTFLYLGAAAYLTSIWVKEQPDQDLERLVGQVL